MPTLDDEFLVTLLHEVGDSFTIPPAGPPAILGRVHRDDDERAGRRRGAGGVGRAAPAHHPGARKPDVIEQRVLRRRHVRHLVQRHAQFVMRVRAVDREVARAHAHHVSPPRRSQQER